MVRAEWDVVFFSGVDWNSHRQRPHWVASELAARGARVTFVDNLGTRLPRLRDARRVARRVRRWAGRSSARDRRPAGLRVVSPLVPSSQQWALVRAAGRRQLLRDIGPVGGGDRPVVVWTYLPLPVVTDVARALGADALVYDWSDDASERALTRSADHRRRLARWEDRMAAEADAVVVASAELLRRRGSPNPRTRLIPHGVVPVDRAAMGPPPPEVTNLPRPRVGFVGSLSEWIDVELLEALARARPAWSFVLVGPVAVPMDGLRRLPNVLVAGERPHASLPPLLAALDVALIPYRIAPATRIASPVKLREYLAFGVPVVSVDLPEVRPFVPPVRLADGVAGFLAEIERAARAGPLPPARVATWSERVDEMADLVREVLAAGGRGARGASAGRR